MTATESSTASRPALPNSTADFMAPARRVSAGLRSARSGARAARDGARSWLLPAALCSALLLIGAELGLAMDGSPATLERPLIAAAAVLLLSLTGSMGGSPGVVVRARATTSPDRA